MISIARAAVLLDFHKSTVWRWVQGGVLRGRRAYRRHHPSGTYQVSKLSVLELIAKLQRQGQLVDPVD
ncbi:MAG: hypothetical protein LAN64_19330 [Acidobacteriia bacterium]|nr:hypothetical protein [Terriglobia bacterium]